MLINVNINGQDSVLSVLNRVLMSREQKHEFARNVGSEMVHRTEQRFHDQKSPDGVPWIRSIRSIFDGGETLRDTGRLLSSLSFEILPSGVRWGFNAKYSSYLHYGARIQAKNAKFLRFKTAYGWVSKKEVVIPARPMLGMNNDDKTYVINILRKVLMK